MQIFIRYQVMDQENPAQPIVATLPLRESLLNFMADGQSAGADVINALLNSAGATDSDGTFTDPFIGGCSPDPFNVATFDQELFMSTNQTLDVRSNHYSLTGRFGCGNMMNGNDVSVAVACP